jgi:hypothetical protein
VNAECKLPYYFPNPVSGDNMEMLAISICQTQPFSSLPDYESSWFDDSLCKGDLLANISRSRLESTGERHINNAIWWENVGHFQINYWLALRPNPKFGAPLDGSRKSYRLLSNDLDLAGMQNEMSTWLASAEPLYSGVDRFTKPLAIAAWSEYLSSRNLKLVTEPLCILEIVSNLRSAIERAKPVIDKEVLSYRRHADLNRLMSIFMREGRHLMAVAGRTLGHVDSHKGAPSELEAAVAAVVSTSYFEPIWRAVHPALAAMFEQQSTEISIEQAGDLCQAMLCFADVMGFVLRAVADGSCYVDVPFRPDNSTPEMR